MKTGTQPFRSDLCGKTRSLLTVAITCAGLSLAAAPATAQTYAVIYNFSVQQSEQPAAGLAIDSSGALYGTTTYTNAGGRDGEAFKMKQHGSSWTFSPLFNFPILGNIDPRSPLLIGPDGTLYGTLFYNYGCDFCDI